MDNNDIKTNEQRILIPIARKCSFKPEDHMIQIDSMNGDGSKRNYLQVVHRVLWFNIYCEEHELNGYINDSDVIYNEALKMIIATCSIYINGQLIAKASGGQAVNDNNCDTVIQTATTIAKGRALANAGFGTAMGAHEDVEGNPCDAGIDSNEKQQKNDIHEQDNNPEPDLTNSALSETSNKQSNAVSKQAGNNRRPSAAPSIPKTVLEARAIMLTSGKYKGKTLGEIAAIDINYLEFYAFKYSGKHPELIEGSKLILNELNKAA